MFKIQKSIHLTDPLPFHLTLMFTGNDQEFFQRLKNVATQQKYVLGYQKYLNLFVAAVSLIIRQKNYFIRNVSIYRESTKIDYKEVDLIKLLEGKAIRFESEGDLLSFGKLIEKEINYFTQKELAKYKRLLNVSKEYSVEGCSKLWF